MSHINNFAFDNTDVTETLEGFKNTANFPDPSSEANVGLQLQKLHSQTRKYINDTLVTKINGLDDDKQNNLEAGDNITIVGNRISASGTVSTDWSAVGNKPQINGHNLASGNNALDTLGIASRDVATISANGLMSSTDKTKLNSAVVSSNVTTIVAVSQSDLPSSRDQNTLYFVF